jgi:hypothetical protein
VTLPECQMHNPREYLNAEQNSEHQSAQLAPTSWQLTIITLSERNT